MNTVLWVVSWDLEWNEAVFYVLGKWTVLLSRCTVRQTENLSETALIFKFLKNKKERNPEKRKVLMILSVLAYSIKSNTICNHREVCVPFENVSGHHFTKISHSEQHVTPSEDKKYKRHENPLRGRKTSFRETKMRNGQQNWVARKKVASRGGVVAPSPCLVSHAMVKNDSD